VSGSKPAMLRAQLMCVKHIMRTNTRPVSFGSCRRRIKNGRRLASGHSQSAGHALEGPKTKRQRSAALRLCRAPLGRPGDVCDSSGLIHAND
jgi:hypothetical protein